MLKTFLTMLLASLSLFTATAASATSAQALSLGNAPAVRVASETGDANKLTGSTAWLVGAIGLGLAVWGVVELTDSDSP